MSPRKPEEIRTKKSFISQTRTSRHLDHAKLRGLARLAAEYQDDELDELTAELPHRRPPKHHTPENKRRKGRNRSHLAHWKTKYWKRRTTATVQRVKKYETLRKES